MKSEQSADQKKRMLVRMSQIKSDFKFVHEQSKELLKKCNNMEKSTHKHFCRIDFQNDRDLVKLVDILKCEHFKF